VVLIVSSIGNLDEQILRFLYLSYFDGEGDGNLKELSLKCSADENEFWKVAGRLSDEGYIRCYASGGSYVVTPSGIIEAEQRGVIPTEKKSLNQEARTLILNHLANVYEKGDINSEASYDEILQQTQLNTKTLYQNSQVLDALGYTESVSMGMSKITYRGLEAVEEWKKQNQLATDFENISNLEPHKRGMQFQSLFRRILESELWLAEEGVRTSHEEMDVIFARSREFYLVECKWEKNPIEAAVVRELLGKLANRVDVKGMIVSMSGFAAGAIEQAIEFASQRIILLLGENDVRSLVYRRVSFDKLLDLKYHALITRKKMLIE
jgi:hypothetical protein